MKKEIPSVVQDEEKPIERNVLAAAIVEMSQSVKRLEKSGLAHEAICILTAHNCRGAGRMHTKPSIKDVRCVFASLSDLQRKFTK